MNKILKTYVAAHAGIAKQFHEAYERLAPEYGYETRPESAVAWSDVPQNNRYLMTAVVEELVEAGVINECSDESDILVLVREWRKAGVSYTDIRKWMALGMSAES